MSQRALIVKKFADNFLEIAANKEFKFWINFPLLTQQHFQVTDTIVEIVVTDETGCKKIKICRKKGKFIMGFLLYKKIVST